MSKITKDILSKASNKASDSKCRYKVSALGFNKKGDYLGCASNYSRYMKQGGGLHAEILLIRKYGSLLDKIILCRVNNKGKFLKIDPCNNCKKILDKYNIKYHTVKI